MTTDGREKHLAVLIDGDNFAAELANQLFSLIAGLGNPIIRRVHGSSSAMNNWREQAGIHSIALREGMSGKNATDMQLAIEAMDILHRRSVEAFCIVSSDSDFAALARRLREDGVVVYGFGEGKAADGFRRACDEFVALQKPAKAEGAASSVPKVPVETQQDDRVARAALELRLPPSKGQVTDITQKLIEQTIRSVSMGRAHVPLAELGSHLSKAARGKGKLKTRLKDYGFILVKQSGGLLVKVPGAAA